MVVITTSLQQAIHKGGITYDNLHQQLVRGYQERTVLSWSNQQLRFLFTRNGLVSLVGDSNLDKIPTDAFRDYYTGSHRADDFIHDIIRYAEKNKHPLHQRAMGEEIMEELLGDLSGEFSPLQLGWGDSRLKDA